MPKFGCTFPHKWTILKCINVEGGAFFSVHKRRCSRKEVIVLFPTIPSHPIHPLLSFNSRHLLLLFSPYDIINAFQPRGYICAKSFYPFSSWRQDELRKINHCSGISPSLQLRPCFFENLSMIPLCL